MEEGRRPGPAVGGRAAGSVPQERRGRGEEMAGAARQSFDVPKILMRDADRWRIAEKRLAVHGGFLSRKAHVGPAHQARWRGGCQSVLRPWRRAGPRLRTGPEAPGIIREAGLTISGIEPTFPLSCGRLLALIVSSCARAASSQAHPPWAAGWTNGVRSRPRVKPLPPESPNPDRSARRAGVRAARGLPCRPFPPQEPPSGDRRPG